VHLNEKKYIELSAFNDDEGESIEVILDPYLSFLYMVGKKLMISPTTFTRV
jgi:hypothetical protein